MSVVVSTVCSSYAVSSSESLKKAFCLILLSGVHSSYSKCDSFIQDFKEGKLQTQPGCSAEDTLEVSGRLKQTVNTFLVKSRQ